ncbi:hypothetical protein CRUP_006823 [Coryphaenoides rupestris]|nr:hypothetical protein CRUP_006823 [Coryphaenoides rupestris]
MQRLRFSANVSWLYTELPDVTQRIYAAASAGFKAVEAAWPYESPVEHIQRAKKDTGVTQYLDERQSSDRAYNLLSSTPRHWTARGHIQVAQAPGRNEPDSAGELNYQYLFSVLEDMGYTEYIGCEYKPLRSTDESLGWLRDYWAASK